MPPIGDRLTDIQTTPRISPEQLAEIERLEREIGKRMEELAPPINDYMLYPLFYTDDLTLTFSGCAIYPVGDKMVAAFVTRDCNRDVKLRTRLYEPVADSATLSLIDYAQEMQNGPTIAVSSHKHDEGRLYYTKKGEFLPALETFEQHMDAFANINETLDLIEAANTETYGVPTFEGIDGEEMVALRERAEPGLTAYVEQMTAEYLKNQYE